MLDSPYSMLGGRAPVLALAEAFYDAMELHEPALAAVHHLDADGRISRASRDHFALFLVGWLGGPQEYIEQRGHPRLRRRHAHVAIDTASRDAWLRSMQRALDAQQVRGDVRGFLDQRFAEVAEFLRNRPG